ncbi:VanZ family protein [Ancylobacter lacus]|uniref:hypothetical protein n=1 Tax=Ancylobacter lacus TaxID=2579970 RepID=UPI001BD0369F|nr:hypothetical protein [Ancylobacter lacus]MBS7540324.1 hypothetical protein [Ancylobacter lacus]
MCRLAGAAAVALIVVLSLLPADEMRRTGAPGVVEHALAYFLAALPLALGWRPGPAPVFALDRRFALGLPALAGMMELLQFFSPGRHPHLADAAASSAGALAGLAVAATLVRWGAPALSGRQTD